jgi:FixJ family two-component response regulator
MGTTSVAIVDDDASANRALQRLLRSAGFNPFGFESAESFLRDASKQCFACLVLDIQLTGMSGLELQRELRKSGSRVPIIFVTAHDDPAFRSAAFSHGCIDFFRKTDPGLLIIEALRIATDASEPG